MKKRRTRHRKASPAVFDDMHPARIEGHIRQRYLHYAFAVGITAATLAFRLALGFSTGDPPVLSLFVLPIILSAYLGGIGPGLVATAVATTSASLFLSPPLSAFSSLRTIDILQMTAMPLAGILVSALSETLHRERRRADVGRRLHAVTLTSIGDAVITTDLEGRIAFLNTEAEQLTGKTQREAAGLPLATVANLEEEATHSPADDLVRRALRPGDANTTIAHGVFHTRGGRALTVDVSASPIREHDGKVLGVVFVIRDCTERKIAEQALQDSEERFRRAIESIPDIVAIYDRNLRIQYINGATRRVTGRPASDFLGRLEEEAWPPEVHSLYLPALQQAAATGDTVSINTDITLPATGQRTLHITYVPIADDRGGVLEILGITRDFTEQRLATEQIRNSLREKEVLLKEVHHRVKNNLQVISSLLSLQATRLKESEARTALRESQFRVRSMSLVHEKLYRSQNLASINFGEYLDAVTTELVRSFSRPGITRLLDVEPIDLAIDTAIPCGLIANELVTNALKHGFPAGMRGTITVALHREDPKTVVMTVQDTGIGLPPGGNPRQMESMGMTLIHSLATQISGQVTLEGTGGTRCAVAFPG